MVYKFWPDLLLVCLAGWLIFAQFRPIASNVATGDCPSAATLTPGKPSSGATELNVWLPVRWNQCWQAPLLSQAAAQVTEIPLGVKLTEFDGGLGQLMPNFAASAAASQAPDLAHAADLVMHLWAQAGYLVPLDECIAQHPTFGEVYDDFWANYRWNGHIWGVPLDVSITVLYYDKMLLRKLGWSETAIARLPEKIRQGQFTLDDLRTTAQQAVVGGVVAPGFGVWPDYGKVPSLRLTYLAYGGKMADAAHSRLIVSRRALTEAFAFHRRLVTDNLMLNNFAANVNLGSWPTGGIYRNTAANHRLLFWVSSSHHWRSYEAAAVERGGAPDLEQNIGIALYPSAMSGRPGLVTPAINSFYVIASEQASGRRNQQAACALLAQTVTATINAFQVTQSATLGVRKDQSEHPLYQQTYLGRNISYMWDYLWTPPHLHRDYGRYLQILREMLPKAERGELTVAEVTAQTIARLQTELTDEIMVEP